MNKFQKAVKTETNKLWKKKFDELLVKYPCMVQTQEEIKRDFVGLSFNDEFYDEATKFVEEANNLTYCKLRKEARATLKRKGVQ